MGVYIWNNLPSEYQEVEYIQSSGTNGSSGQYINTGIIPEPANTVVKLRTMPTSSSYSIYLCSCMVNKGTAQTNYYYGLSFTANRWHCGYGTADTTPGHPLVDFSYTWNWGNTIYDVEYRNDDLYVNNTLVANATTNVSNFQYPMFLFARNNGGTAGVFSSFKLYSCEIYKSGTLVRNFIPCYRKSDNVVGLYDLVNNQFYTNSGTGTFSKGSDVNTYRESSLKNAYIGEYTVPTSGLLGYRPLQSDLKDLSGNGNDGSWYSGTGSFGTVGGKTGAIVNRGSDDYSTQHIVTTLNYAGPTLTICGWVYYNSLSYNNGYWHGVMTNSTSTSSYISLSDRPAQSSRWTVGGNGNLLTATTSATTGAWHFVAGVLTSSGKKIYLNGTQIASDSTGFTTGQGSIWRLGCGQTPDTSGKFGGTNGYVRHCAVYNRALTVDEILEFYNKTA